MRKPSIARYITEASGENLQSFYGTLFEESFEMD
jgi:hypothetical protein